MVKLATDGDFCSGENKVHFLSSGAKESDATNKRSGGQGMNLRNIFGKSRKSSKIKNRKCGSEAGPSLLT